MDGWFRTGDLRLAGRRRLPHARRPPQGDDPARRREHRARRRSRTCCALTRRWSTPRASGSPTRSTASWSPCRGLAQRRGRRQRADRPLPGAARGVQGAERDPHPRRDPADRHRQAPAPAHRGPLRRSLMRFAVVGAGAIGAYVGAALARGGADVTLIARGPHLRAMQEHGVRVQSARGDFHVHPPATDDFDAIGDADVVFLALKAHSLPDVAERIGVGAGSGRGGDRRPERRALVVPPAGLGGERRPRRPDRGRHRDRARHRLRHLLLDRDRRAGRHPPHRRAALRARRAGRRTERALRADLRGVQERRSARARRERTCARRSG